MKKFAKASASFLATIIDNHCEKVGEAIEERNLLDVVLYMGLVLLDIISICVAVLGICTLIWRYWEFLALPAILLICIQHYSQKKIKEPTPPPPPPPTPTLTIDEVITRAKQLYPIMEEVAYILLKDLSLCVQGLVVPTNLTTVKATNGIEVTPKLVTKFIFVIGKGTCISTSGEIKKVLDQILAQHLMAGDLPIAVDNYISLEGSEWPGLVVDGVYDLGTHFRVDLVLTDEAEVAVLKDRNRSVARKGTIVMATDPDFD